MRGGVALAFALLAVACSGPPGDVQLSQTAIGALETREYDAPYDVVFDAAVNALFDLGYRITASDKRGGVVVAAGAQLKLDRRSATRTAVRVCPIELGQRRLDEEAITALHAQIGRRLAVYGPSGAGS